MLSCSLKFMKSSSKTFLSSLPFKRWDGLKSISLLAFLSVVICSIQLIYRPDKNNQLPRTSPVYKIMENNTFKASLIVGMSISIPVLVDFILNVMYSSGNIGFTRGSISRGVLLFTNLLTNAIMLFVAIPINDAVLLLCMFHLRGLMLTYAITAHLWEFGAPVFRSNLHIFGTAMSLLGYGVPILTNYTWFTMQTMIISYFIIIFLSMTAFTILVIRWIKYLKKKSFKGLTSAEYSCMIYILAPMLMIPSVLVFIIVYKQILSYESPNIYFIGLTYSSSVFTVVVTVLESRVMNREMYIQQEILGKKRAFVRYVSHEMRTPLNTVIMGLDVLRKELLVAKVDPDTLECVEELQKSCDIAVDILNDLLNYEKLDAGLMKLEETLVEAGPFFQTAVNSFQIQARQAGINLLFTDMSEDVSRTLMKVDVSKLSQVVRNFTSNALKFSPHDGGGVVTVTVSVINKSERVTQSSVLPTREPDRGSIAGDIDLIQSFVQFRMEDNGAGISQENQKRLFKEIVQFNPGKLQGGGGSGLGLWISRAIVDLHGGGVIVSSPGEGLGSTFTMEIPVYPIGVVDPRLQQSIAVRNSTQSRTPFISSRLGRVVAPPTIVPVCVQTEFHSTQANETEAQRVNREGFPDSKSDEESHIASCHVMEGINGQDSLSLGPLPLSQSLENDVDVTLNEKFEHFRLSIDDSKVLVVDDSTANRKMVCRALKSRGFKNIVQAEDGEKAVQKIRESLEAAVDMIEIVLMDYQMPLMDGPSAASVMRGLGFQGLIAGITGNALSADIEYFKSQGANVVFAKPISIDEVIATIESFQA